ncbi:MAG: Cu(I)-responsive transcriptional regulator [Saccharospirillum sp.]|nr:Cu(I)-responsive transcriptional regulator [Saccharospirillum sp.]
MQIKAAAQASGLPAKTIRYYESLGLIHARRTDNGYRHYSQADLDRMIFIKRSRNLGFTLDECRNLLSLYENPSRASAEVKSIAKQHLNDIEHKLAELQALRATLSDLVERCQGDNNANCVILDRLSLGPVDENGPMTE